MPVMVYQCECWSSAVGCLVPPPDVVIPFACRLELGLAVNIRSFRLNHRFERRVTQYVQSPLHHCSFSNLSLHTCLYAVCMLAQAHTE